MGTRVIVADGESVRRVGLVSCIQKCLPEYDIVAVLGHGRDLLKKLEYFQPDLLITEIALPGIHMPEVGLRLAKLRLTKLVCLVGRNEMAFIEDMEIVGSLCLLQDDDHIGNICRVKEYVAKGWDDGNLSLMVPPSSKPDRDVMSRLSPRERQVYRLLLRGLRSKAIAKVLGISPRTVESHRRSIKSIKATNCDNGKVVGDAYVTYTTHLIETSYVSGLT